LNVLIIGQYFPPDLGGAATRAYNIAKGLSLNECKVTVVTAFPHYPDGKVPKEYKNKFFKVDSLGKIKVIRTFILPLESKGLFKRLMLFVSFAVSSLFVLPLVGANPSILVLLPSLFYGMVKRKPVVSNVDDLMLEDLYDLNLLRKGSVFSKIAEHFTTALFSKVEAATPISPGYVNTLTGYGVDKSKIQVIIGGVDLNIFKPKFKRDPGGKFSVLYSGAFSRLYNFEQIFKAAKIVEQLDDGIEFVVQGKGELLSSMLSKVNELKVKNVRIIDKTLNREDVAKLLGQADALILPLMDLKKPYRGISSKLYEYQAVGKPIICCCRGLPGDYIKTTRSGLVVNPGEYSVLAKAVLELKSNADSAREMGENGRKYVESEASIEAVGLKIKKIFERITEAKD